MAIRIRSLASSGPLVVPLSSGRSVRLSPGESSDELPDVEVTNNPKIDKLRERRMIEVQPTSADNDSDAKSDSAAGTETEEEPGAEKAQRRSSRSREK